MAHCHHWSLQNVILFCSYVYLYISFLLFPISSHKNIHSKALNVLFLFVLNVCMFLNVVLLSTCKVIFHKFYMIHISFCFKICYFITMFVCLLLIEESILLGIYLVDYFWFLQDTLCCSLITVYESSLPKMGTQGVSNALAVQKMLFLSISVKFYLGM